MNSISPIKRGISLFSFQQKYYTGAMTLEDCLAQASKLGVQGIEMLVDQMVPGYPSITYNLSDAFVDRWNEMLQQYKLEAVCLDIYGETKLHKRKKVTNEELLQQLLALMKTAKALNFSFIRLTMHLPYEVIEACIPHAEEQGIKLASEVHAPHLMTGEWVRRNVELIEKTGTKHLGLMPDLGTFSRTIPPVVIAESLRKGGQQRIAEYLNDVYVSREIPKDLMAKVGSMGGNDLDMWLAMRVMIETWTYQNPKALAEFMPYVTHVHGKFYEVTNELREPSVDYDGVMDVLTKSGYNGYIMSEYEGQRLTQDIEDPNFDEIEQVTRHQAMLRRYLGQ
ncbi:sugar phosphate isomerase/epimerase [Paenibacillus phyllosphaerae]|uniref:Sugar phosphate isomerase/epimerase n=1 Tax=Paenibacillus phyllosphaerae TaxID=274593 RepID=A0A7W5B5S3_9BACL|nr:TIM barrel protein [Paenibacillus phyllosphaerae]MBB3114156.1 sugar phosphate isomerase/epimerase [Paenibacillus phyllosphaerae]